MRPLLGLHLISWLKWHRNRQDMQGSFRKPGISPAEEADAADRRQFRCPSDRSELTGLSRCFSLQGESLAADKRLISE